MNGRARYRARVEWSGIELFDRRTGSVVKACGEEGESLKALLRRLLSAKRGDGSPVSSRYRGDGCFNSCEKQGDDSSDSSEKHGDVSFAISERLGEALVSKYGLIRENVPDIEPLIDTPFPKSRDFASAPRRIYFELTRRCNLNCRSCFNRSFSAKDEMSFADIERISRRLYEIGVYEIRCTGGEPTQRKDFFEILGMLSELGFYISVGTNGNYSPETMGKMVSSPVDLFILSLDGGTEGVNDAVRGAGSFKKALDTLGKMSSGGRRIRINTLIRRGNHTYGDIRRIAEIASRYNVESINCIPLRPVASDPEILKLQLDPTLFREFVCGLSRLRNEFDVNFVTTLDLRPTNSHDRVFIKEKACAAGREGAVISPYGEIYGCSYSPASSLEEPWERRKPFVAGNVLDEDVLSIWNDSPAWAIFRDLDRYKHPACKACSYYLDRRCIGNCPIMDKDDPAAFDPYCYLNIE